jgi:hypothetical protein
MKQALWPHGRSKQLGIALILAAVAPAGRRSATKGERLCIPCAVNRPDFKERAPSVADSPFDGADARAWIGGRAFALVRHPLELLTCSRCGEEAAAVYLPYPESEVLTEN